jgi:hypothetical protein
MPLEGSISFSIHRLMMAPSKGFSLTSKSAADPVSFDASAID